jgi:hypothetical protein
LARSRSLEKAQKPGSQQLQHVLSQVPELIKIPEVLAPEASAEEGKGEPAATKPVGSLASPEKAFESCRLLKQIRFEGTL